MEPVVVVGIVLIGLPATVFTLMFAYDYFSNKDWVIEKQGFVEATGNTIRGSFDYTAKAIIRRNKKTGERQGYIFSPRGTSTIDVPISELERQIVQ